MSNQFNVMKQPMRCLACVVALGLTSTVHAQLNIQFDVSVTEVEGLFRYDYTLANLLTSSVGVNGFLMSVENGADILNMEGPEEWMWLYQEEERNLQVAWLDDTGEFDIEPGTEAIFSLSSSFGPGSQEYFVAKFSADFFDILGSVEGLVSAPSIPPMTPLDCNGDGQINANDLACACGAEIRDELIVALNLIEGDLDGDGEVAFADFLVLSSNFGEVVESYSEGDIDCNGVVEFPDFLVLSSNFGQAGGGVAAAVPEPSGFLLAGLAACCLLSRRRRRDNKR